MYKLLFKRIIDLIFSTILLIVLSPLLSLVSLIIILIDGCPIFFIQERIGKDNNPFRLIKFRSMQVDTKNDENRFLPNENHRVTSLGALLRRYKIDEFPQFLNVMKGDMSIVGPRPEVETWVEKFSEEFDKILTIKPGITDYASIKFRNEELILEKSQDPLREYNDHILPTKLALNIDYLENYSFILDIKIMFLTFFSILENTKR